MQCRVEAMHVGLHDVNAIVVHCAGGNRQLPTSVQPLLRLLDTCLLHTRQVLRTLLHAHMQSQHCDTIVVVLNCHHSCACSHRHFHAKSQPAIAHKYVALASCACLPCSSKQRFIYVPEMQVLSLSCHVDATLTAN